MNKLDKSGDYPVDNKKDLFKIYNENEKILRPKQILEKIMNYKPKSFDETKEEFVPWETWKLLNDDNIVTVITSLLFQRMIWFDPDFEYSAWDVRLQVGDKPHFYIKKLNWWERMHDFPEINTQMMDIMTNLMTPAANKKEIARQEELEWRKDMDVDCAFNLNINNHFSYKDAINAYENAENKFITDFFINPQYKIDEINDYRTVFRFRCNITKSLWKKVVVCRKIEKEIPDFYDLKLEPKFLSLIRKEKGIVFITWPTGSWKSTTMAALINEVNKTQKKHIVTLEDPVEYVHPNKMSFFTHREVKKDTLTYASGGKSALRQKPDIVIFWELRDVETVRAALEMAETWHLVFATLHTFSAAKTIDRIISLFTPEEQWAIAESLAGAFVGSIAQTLVKSKKGICWLYEFIIWTDAVRKTIKDNDSSKLAWSVDNDKWTHITMVDHAFKLIKNWVVEQNELFTKIAEQDRFLYESLISKIKNDNTVDYEEKLDTNTMEYIRKEEKEIEDKIRKEMWLEEDNTEKKKKSVVAEVQERLIKKDEQKNNSLEFDDKENEKKQNNWKSRFWL